MADILSQKNIPVPEDSRIVVYNNTFFTSPIELYLTDEFQDDYAVIILPPNYPVPKTKNNIIRAGNAGFPLHILTPPGQ